jgi:hypothetical protein
MDLSVTASTLALQSITEAQLSAGVVGTDEILDGALVTGTLGAAVTADSIVDGTVTRRQLSDITDWAFAPGAVTSDKLNLVVPAELIADGAFTASTTAFTPGALTNKLASQCVGYSAVAPQAVDASKLASPFKVTTRMYERVQGKNFARNSVMRAHLSDGAVGPQSWAAGVVMSAASLEARTLADGAVTGSVLTPSSVGQSKLGLASMDGSVSLLDRTLLFQHVIATGYEMFDSESLADASFANEDFAPGSFTAAKTGPDFLQQLVDGWVQEELRGSLIDGAFSNLTGADLADLSVQGAAFAPASVDSLATRGRLFRGTAFSEVNATSLSAGAVDVAKLAMGSVNFTMSAQKEALNSAKLGIMYTLFFLVLQKQITTRQRSTS